MAKLTDFMVSKVRSKLIKLFLSEPSQMYYVRELTRALKEEINAVRRELSRMQEKGMVKSEQRGNRLYYQFKESYPYYNELLSIVAKSTGLGRSLLDNRAKLGFIKYAFLSTRFIRGDKRKEGTVDLMLVGKIIMPQLDLIVKEYEGTRGEINYTTMTEDEFNYRQNRKDPFLGQILTQSRVMIIGQDNDF